MFDAFYNDLTIWFQSLGLIGLFVILIFAFFHCTFEGPFSLFLMVTAGLILDSFILGALIVLFVHFLGLPFFYWLVHFLDQKSNYWLKQQKLSNQILLWVESQPAWKHVIVIGLPSINTYLLKVAFTLNLKDLKHYMLYLMGSYSVLFIGNLLLYYGILGIFTSQIPAFVSVLLLLILIMFIYFGNRLLPKKEKENK